MEYYHNSYLLRVRYAKWIALVNAKNLNKIDVRDTEATIFLLLFIVFYLWQSLGGCCFQSFIILRHYTLFITERVS